MAFFQLGQVIRTRREALGMSQKELSAGICAEATLSRIENGERMPTGNHLRMLLQRLGYLTLTVDQNTDYQRFQVYELKYKIRQAYLSQEYEDARADLAKMENILTEPSVTDRQFVLLQRILLNGEADSLEEKRKDWRPP